MNFSQKVVLITGASSGIGAATAVQFAKEGADVIIVGRNEERLNKIASKCETVGTKPLVIKADISKDEDAKTVIQKTIDTYGKLDVLVNNAGILREGSIFEETFVGIFDEIMSTNVRAVVLLTSLAAPYLIESKGSIVNISSVAANSVNMPNFSSYKTSKAALNHFSNCMALELAPYGVRVNAISPGVTNTEIFNAAGVPNFADGKHSASVSVLGRVSEPEEMADMIMYLASDKAKGITGSNYVIDNGYLLKH